MKHYGLFLLLIAVAGAALAASDDDPLDKSALRSASFWHKGCRCPSFLVKIPTSQTF